MNSNRKSRERSSEDNLRHVEPYKRSTKDKQTWYRGGRTPNAQYSKWDEAA